MSDVLAEKNSWLQAYKAFLLDRNESTFLKIAPLILLFGSPEVVASNLIPVVGEAVDISALTLTMIVGFRTLNAVRKHR